MRKTKRGAVSGRQLPAGVRKPDSTNVQFPRLVISGCDDATCLMNSMLERKS